jgi:hypothetical protein
MVVFDDRAYVDDLRLVAFTDEGGCRRYIEGRSGGPPAEPDAIATRQLLVQIVRAPAALLLLDASSDREGSRVTAEEARRWLRAPRILEEEDVTPSEPEKEMADLLRRCVESAREYLAESDSFIPFAWSLGEAGLEYVLGRNPADGLGADHSSVTRENLEFLAAALRREAGRRTIRATATCADGRLRGRDPADALLIDAEHRDAQARRTVIPYRRTHDGLALSEPQFEVREAAIFAD